MANNYDSITELVPIPEWSRDDFSTEKPYEWLYDFRDNGFLMAQLQGQLKDRAAAVGVRNFIALWNEFQKMKAKSGRVELRQATAFDGQPVELYCGAYVCDDNGVRYINALGMTVVVCRHPIIPIRRMVNIDSGEQRLEIAFKRGNTWRSVVVERDVLASQQKILALSRLGVAVDSESAKELVKYITFLEAQNYEKLGETKSVNRLGWVEGKDFSPYKEGLEFDGDLSFKHMFDAVSARGSAAAWLGTALQAREGGKIARIMLAASFASALVEPLGCLPFFVHVWGGTEAGKTVGLMLAASVWANPTMGEYIKTFNTTAVGLEMMAGFCNSLPLCLDELQIVKDKADFDKTIYMLTEGVGRNRGAKAGGLQKVYTWKNCILTTGEMPITNPTSGGGAVNRIIEVDCKDEKLFDNPREVANAMRSAYGHAGRDFIRKYHANDGQHRARELYQQFYTELLKGESTEKQAMAAAVLLTADRLAGEWIFADDGSITVADLAQYLTRKEDVDVNSRALDWLYDFTAENTTKHFKADGQGEIWGEIGDRFIYIIKSVFDREMRAAGFNPASFLSWANRNGILNVTNDGRNRLTLKKRIKGTDIVTWCVCIRQADALEDVDVDALPF